MNIKEKIMADCSKNIKEEVCGFVYMKDGEFDIIPLKNKAENPQITFYIPSKDFLYYKRNFDLVAVYHSHTIGDAKESDFDIKTSDLICYPFVIFSITNSDFHIYKPAISEVLTENIDLLEGKLK